MSKKTIIGIVFGIAAVSVGGYSLFSKKNGSQQESGMRKRDKDPIPVKVTLVRKEISPRVLEATVSLEGLSQVDVYARAAGRLASQDLREGTVVKRGQILFKVDRTDPGENFMATPVESPVNGWVAKWNYNVGTQITTQMPIVQVVDDHILRATISLPSKEWALISTKTGVEVETGDQLRKARIFSVARAADPSTGRGTFDIEVDNVSRSLRAGMTGTAKIKVDPKPRIILPAQAVILTDEGAFVYAVDNNIAIRKAVKYDMLNNDVLEILSGIDNDTLIATSGNNILSDKAAVRVLNGKPGEQKKESERRPEEKKESERKAP